MTPDNTGELVRNVTRREFLSVAGPLGAAEFMAGDTASIAQTTPTIRPEAELCFKDALELSRLIHKRELSAREVMTAFLAQIKRVNPKVNAIPTLIGWRRVMQSP